MIIGGSRLGLACDIIMRANAELLHAMRVDRLLHET